jgi:glycosyltransferase involved in cell wall biosynthesis
MMRVAFITHYTNLYGANRSLLNLVDGLSKYDVAAYVIAPKEGDVTKALDRQHVRMAIIPIQWWMGRRGFNGADSRSLRRRFSRYLRWRHDALARIYGNIRVLPALTRQLKLWNIDVVYTNSSVTPIGALAAWIIRRPHVWHLREFGDLDYGLHYDWGRGVFTYFVRKANAAIAISEAIRSYHLRDARPGRACVIYNGVASVAEFDRLREIVDLHPISRPDRPYTFALVGSVRPPKGQDVAIRALSLLARDIERVRLLIVGEGKGEAQIDQLKALAQHLGVGDKVEFWGYIDDPFRAYLESDAALMCSKNEAMGRVTTEAMSACRPVIGYDEAGTSEIIEHGRTGLLYRGGPQALADCMRQFVENPSWAHQLGKNAWQTARSKYSVEVYARSVYEVLSSVVKS